MSNLGKLFILIGIMWLFQLWFAYKQSKIFQDDIRVKDGLVLRGFTIFARSKQLSAYTGFSVNEIASGNRVAEGEKKKVQEAALNSAQYILDHFERVKIGGE